MAIMSIIRGLQSGHAAGKYIFRPLANQIGALTQKTCYKDYKRILFTNCFGFYKVLGASLEHEGFESPDLVNQHCRSLSGFMF